MSSVLLDYFPQEIVDNIMMYLDTQDIQKIGEKNVSEFVWLRKKDKNWIEACKNNNIIGFHYLIMQIKNIKLMMYLYKLYDIKISIL
jgi:hypothetical protein